MEYDIVRNMDSTYSVVRVQTMEGNVFKKVTRLPESYHNKSIALLAMSLYIRELAIVARIFTNSFGESAV